MKLIKKLIFALPLICLTFFSSLNAQNLLDSKARDESQEKIEEYQKKIQDIVDHLNETLPPSGAFKDVTNDVMRKITKEDLKGISDIRLLNYHMALADYANLSNDMMIWQAAVTGSNPKGVDRGQEETKQRAARNNNTGTINNSGDSRPSILDAEDTREGMKLVMKAKYMGQKMGSI